MLYTLNTINFGYKKWCKCSQYVFFCFAFVITNIYDYQLQELNMAFAIVYQNDHNLLEKMNFNAHIVLIFASLSVWNLTLSKETVI